MINLMIEINGTEDVKQFTKMLEVITNSSNQLPNTLPIEK